MTNKTKTSKQRHSLADKILSSNDRPLRKLHVTDWDADVYVRIMSGNERDAFEAEMIERRGTNGKQNLRGLRASLCVRVMCDEDGVRLFDDADAEELGEKSAAALDQVFDAAQSANAAQEKPQRKIDSADK